MENDLISRSALLKRQQRYTEFDEAGFSATVKAVEVDEIQKAPAVDAVEVIRCRDCGRFMEYTEEYKATIEGADGDCYIRKINSEDEQFCAVMYDDFCSDGRRRADDG